MKGTGDEFFSCAAFAANENRGFEGGASANIVVNILHSLRRANEPTQTREFFIGNSFVGTNEKLALMEGTLEGYSKILGRGGFRDNVDGSCFDRCDC